MFIERALNAEMSRHLGYEARQPMPQGTSNHRNGTSAKTVFNDMETRGCNDVLIAVTDGLKGMGEALGVVYPAATLQTCIVHLMRNSLDFASWKDRNAFYRPDSW